MTMAHAEPRELDGTRGWWMRDLHMFGTAGYGVVYVLDASPPVVVDTGMGRHTGWICDLLDRLEVDRAAPITILLTHVHLDHAGGVAQLCAAFPDAQVFVHGRGAPHLADPSRLIAGTKRAVGGMWRYYDPPAAVDPDRIRTVEDGELLEVGDRRFTAHAAPGHAPHQLIYHDHAADLLFCGDAMGIRLPDSNRVFASTPPPQFDLAQSRADVAMIADREPAGLCYAHHGYRRFDQGVATQYDRTLSQFVDETTQALQRHPLERVIDAVAAEYDAAAVWGEEKTRAEASLNVRGVAAMDG